MKAILLQRPLGRVGVALAALAVVGLVAAGTYVFGGAQTTSHRSLTSGTTLVPAGSETAFVIDPSPLRPARHPAGHADRDVRRADDGAERDEASRHSTDDGAL